MFDRAVLSCASFVTERANFPSYLDAVLTKNEVIRVQRGQVHPGSAEPAGRLSCRPLCDGEAGSLGHRKETFEVRSVLGHARAETEGVKTAGEHSGGCEGGARGAEHVRKCVVEGCYVVRDTARV